MIYQPEELAALGEIILAHDLWVLSDEIYEKLVYGGANHVSIGSLSPELLAHTLISSGFSKAYAMTGWRLGFLAGPKAVIQAAAGLQSHSTSNVAVFVQRGGLAALQDPRAPQSIETMRLAFEARRDFVCARLRELPGISFVPPEGAFYVLLNIAATGLDSQTFCAKLLNEEKVALVPGVAFGVDDHVRISYATDQITLDKALNRLAAFLAQLV
jgi:aspartate aminotransferase